MKCEICDKETNSTNEICNECLNELKCEYDAENYGDR